MATVHEVIIARSMAKGDSEYDHFEGTNFVFLKGIRSEALQGMQCRSAHAAFNAQTTEGVNSKRVPNSQNSFADETLPLPIAMDYIGG